MNCNYHAIAFPEDVRSSHAVKMKAPGEAL